MNPVTVELGGEVVARLLVEAGIDTIFGIPGVHTLEFYRGFARQPGLRLVLARHEQALTLMADGYARATGKVGVACVITGPGVTNAATGIGQSWSDSVGTLTLASVNRSASLGRGWGDLHESKDQLGLVRPITGFAATAYNVDELPALLDEALHSAQSGRRRPAFLQVPIDVLAADVPSVHGKPESTEPSTTPRVLTSGSTRESLTTDSLHVLQTLASANLPAVVIGGGCVDAAPTLQTLLERLQLPVVCTVAGKGVLPDDHPLAVGAVLSTAPGRQWLAGRDLVLALGTELADSDTLEDLTLPRVLRVDIESAAPWYPVEHATRSDVSDFAREALRLLDGRGDPNTPTFPARHWGDARSAAAEAREAALAGADDTEHLRRAILDVLDATLPRQRRIVTDMTQLAYTGNVCFPAREPRTWVHPVGFGTLGYALPAAIGAALGTPDVRTVAIVGDGGIMYNLAELVTAAELNLPLTVLLWNNDSLGQIRDDMIANGIPELGVTPMTPDFLALARSCGCRATRIQDLQELEDALNAPVDGPLLIEIHGPTFRHATGTPADVTLNTPAKD